MLICLKDGATKLCTGPRPALLGIMQAGHSKYSVEYAHHSRGQCCPMCCKGLQSQFQNRVMICR